MELKDHFKKVTPKLDNVKLLNKIESEVFYIGRYGINPDSISIIDILENEILHRLNSTALICNIMSIVACAITENNVTAACDHLRYILNLENRYLDIDAIVVHLRDIVINSNIQQR